MSTLWTRGAQVKRYSLSLCDSEKSNHYDGIIVAVSHDDFKVMGVEKFVL